MCTTVERPTQLKHQIPRGNEIVPLDRARPLHPDRALPPQVQLPQQGSSSERNVTSGPSHRQSDMNVVAPRPLKASDSDPDMYFNDEDNDVLLAIDDSMMQGVEPLAAMVGNVQDRNESSRGAGGTRPHVATAQVKLLSQQIT